MVPMVPMREGLMGTIVGGPAPKRLKINYDKDLY